MKEMKMKAASARGRPAVSEAKRLTMRSKIADVAKQLFQDEGYAKVSMRRIAGELGCAPMTLYKYYDAKVDILRTLWADVMGDLFDNLDALPIKEIGYLHDLGAAYIQYWMDQPDYYRMVFMAEGITQPDVSGFIDSPELLQRFDIFARAISDGCAVEPSPEELKTKLDAYMCFLTGITHNLITISGYPWPKTDKLLAMAVSAVTD